MGFWQIARGDLNCLTVPLNLFAFFQYGRRQFGCTKPRLAFEIALKGQANERHRVEPMFGSKGFGLIQRFAGDHGDLHFQACAGPVKHQILNIIGRAPHQCSADLVAPICVIWAGCIQLQILDLRIWKHQLGGQTTRRQTQGRATQVTQRLCQIFGVERGFTDLQPTARGAMQKGNGGVGDV